MGRDRERDSFAMMAPSVLAYVGDAVLELFVRATLVTEGGGANTRALHQAATRLVRAGAQARMARLLAAELSPEEAAIMRRGRNAHCGRVPPGATLAEYRLATGLEALFGQLYLSGQDERLRTLLRKAFLSAREDAEGK